MEDEGERARKVQEFYREALDLAEQAVLADRQKQYDVAECLYREASNIFNRIIEEDLETEDKKIQIQRKAIEYISRADFLHTKEPNPDYNNDSINFSTGNSATMELPSLYQIMGSFTDNHLFSQNQSYPFSHNSTNNNINPPDQSNKNDITNAIGYTNNNINGSGSNNISAFHNNISSYTTTTTTNAKSDNDKNINTPKPIDSPDDEFNDIKYVIEEQGRWTSENSGGSISNYSFYKNPQYKLNIHPTLGENGFLKAVAKTKNNLPVNIRLVGGGTRVSTVTKSDITSGAYRHGHCSFEILSIEPGDYTIIVSTFHQKEEGDFSLTLGCSIPFSLTAIPPEGDGMLETVIDGQWIQNVTAMGCVHYNNYFGNPTYRITMSEPTYLLIRLQIQVMKPPGMHIAIFELQEDGTPGNEIASSGAYCNLIQGVVTEKILLMPEFAYIIIFSTWEPTPGPFTAYIYSNNMIEIQEVCH